MGALRGVVGQRGIVIRASRVGIQRKVELILPPELEPGLGQRVIAALSSGVSLGQVRGMRGDFIRDDAGLHVFFRRQAEVFLGCHVAEHGAPVPADHGRADPGCNVIVSGRHVGGEGPQGIERGLVTRLQLPFHVFMDHVHGHVAWSFDHDLHVVRPGVLGQFAQRLEFGKLRRVVGIGNRAGSQSVPETEGDVIRFHDLADFLEVGIRKIFPVMRQTPFGVDGPAS